MTPEFILYTADAADGLASEIVDECVDCCVTSPPYYKQRDYKHPGQLGQEDTVEDYVRSILKVTAQVHRVLKPTGSFWLNVDDSYVKKDLQLIPLRIAQGMRSQGWKFRCDVIWRKTGLIPKTGHDRITREHEYIFHAVKKLSGYYFDQDPIREPHSEWAQDCIDKAQASGAERRKDYDMFNKEKRRQEGQKGISRADFGATMNPKGRQKRSVWNITPSKTRLDHYATFPPELADICIKSSCVPQGVVLDPFTGSGTTGVVALGLGRDFIGFELTPEASKIAMDQLSKAGEGENVVKCVD